MTDPRQPGCSATFRKMDVLAAPEHAAHLRHEFSAWLQAQLTLDPVKGSDVVLAVYEALANAAEFAYVGTAKPGVMHVQADYDHDAEILTVTVTDEGVWRAPDPDVSNPARGRGIPLMHALTDRAVIDSTPTGTQVRLQWDHLSALPA